MGAFRDTLATRLKPSRRNADIEEERTPPKGTCVSPESNSLHLRSSDEESCARASHRILTLLTTISANLSMLRKPDLLRTCEDYDEALSEAGMALEELRRTLTNLFALEDIRPGRNDCIPASEIDEIVKVQIANIRFRYPHPETVIETEIETGGRGFPLGSRELETVLENLLDNARKFCDKPIPTIRLAISCDPSSAVITVEDNGCGIQPADRDRVFDRFFQAGERAPHPRGVGLGLPLVKALVVARNGNLSLRSTPGSGTAVTLAIPNPPSRAHPTQSSTSTPGR